MIPRVLLAASIAALILAAADPALARGSSQGGDGSTSGRNDGVWTFNSSTTAGNCPQLEPRDVTILGLHYLEDLTYQQIAETLRITPSRVCQLLWRAVDRLRARLGEQTMQEAA